MRMFSEPRLLEPARVVVVPAIVTVRSATLLTTCVLFVWKWYLLHANCESVLVVATGAVPDHTALMVNPSGGTTFPAPGLQAGVADVSVVDSEALDRSLAKLKSPELIRKHPPTSAGPESVKAVCEVDADVPPSGFDLFVLRSTVSIRNEPPEKEKVLASCNELA